MVFMPPAAESLTDDGDRAPEWPLRRLGRFLASIRDLILPLLGAVAVPRRASREGAMVFIAFSHLAPRFAPKVVLLLIITVEEVFNCRSVHPKVNM